MADRSQDPDATRAFYDRISHVYDAIAVAAEHGARERGKEILDVAPGERVLEVGFGPGRALVAFARGVGRDGKVVDVSNLRGQNKFEGQATDTLARVVAQATSQNRMVLVQQLDPQAGTAESRHEQLAGETIPLG